MIGNLSETDVVRLMADPSEANRAEAAAKVAQHFELSDIGPRERALAEQIIRLMTRDAAVRVRHALSNSLKTSTLLPHDVALARDVEEVALPMLEHSAVLTEHDLVEIVRAAGSAKQTAVAGRATVPAAVADALIDSRNPAAVVRLVANDGAALSEQALQTVLDRYGKEEAVKERMTHRATLPLTVAERLVAMVSEKLRDYLVAHHELSPSVAADPLMESREPATVSLLPEGASGEGVEALAKQMMTHGRLSPSVILRSLCMGDLAFFEASLAALSRIPILNARILIHDEGPLGLQAIYRRARLPENMYAAFRVAVDVVRQTGYDGGEQDRQRYVARTIERILTQFEDVGEDNLDYLLHKLNQLAA